jgi:glycosyltransferase involved in cell wall biosynthesis
MRTLRLVEQLVADPAGWEVAVITATPNTRMPYEPVDPALVGRVPPAVRVLTAPALRPVDRATRAIRHLVPKAPAPAAGSQPVAAPAASTPASGQSRSLARQAIDLVDMVTSIPDAESGWIAPALCRAALARALRPDVLYSTAPSWSAQIIGYGLANYWRCRWVADFRDPWARGPWREDRPAFTLRSWQAMERRVVQRADAVVFNTRRAVQEFESFYGPDISDKLHLVRNGCDVHEFESLSGPANDEFVLLHAGSLYGGRRLEVLLAAIASGVANRWLDPQRFKLRLLGATPDPASAAIVEKYGLGRAVEFSPRVPRHQSLQEIAGASALLLLQQGHGLSVPAKTYEYLAAGRPILALTDDGETADVIRASGVGIVAQASDPDVVGQALRGVIEMARRGVSRPARNVYDGAERARELVSILRSQAFAGDATLAGAIAPTSKSRHA